MVALKKKNRKNSRRSVKPLLRDGVNNSTVSQCISRHRGPWRLRVSSQSGGGTCPARATDPNAPLHRLVRAHVIFAHGTISAVGSGARLLVAWGPTRSHCQWGGCTAFSRGRCARVSTLLRLRIPSPNSPHSCSAVARLWNQSSAV